MDAFMSQYMNSVDIDSALAFASAADTIKLESLPVVDTLTIDQVFANVQVDDAASADYQAGIPIDPVFFGESTDSLFGDNEEASADLQTGAIRESTPAQPIAAAEPALALPPIIPETQPEVIQPQQTYIRPPPSDDKDELESQTIDNFAWDDLVDLPSYPEVPGWNNLAQPMPAHLPPVSMALPANGISSTLAKPSLRTHILLPNQQQPVLPTPPYSQPPSHVPSRAPTPAPHPLISQVPSRMPTPAPLALIPSRREKPLGRIPARQTRDNVVNYAAYYDSLPETPRAWGGVTPQRPKFQYTSQGMWKPNLTFTREDLLEYMTSRKAANAPLTVWLQNCPAGSNARCPDRGTRLCRFRDCPAASRSILKGWWRIAFDEHPEKTGVELDPFHCAGFMHLYCFEKCFDLVEMIRSFDVRADTRQFDREEKNFMALTRDHGDHVVDFERWRKAQDEKWELWQGELAARASLGLPLARPMTREDHLWHVLTVKHMEKESSARQSVRDHRGGSSIDKHQGDLDMYVAMKTADKRTKAEAMREAKTALMEKMAREQDRKPTKRARDDADDDADYDIGKVSPRSTGMRPIKRVRTRGTARDGEVSPAQPSPGTRRSPRTFLGHSSARYYTRSSF